jgi:hypothetical protein
MKKLILTLLVLLIFQGCQTTNTILKEQKSKFLESELFKVSKDRGKVFYVQGEFLGGSFFNLNHRFASDFFINKKNIGSKTKDDVMVFELKPGEYEFFWDVKGGDFLYDAGNRSKFAVPEILKTKILGGEILILKGNYNSGDKSYGLLGPIFSSTPKSLLEKISDKSKRTIINGKKIVSPQKCDVNLCLK